jgi:hypothetical protein
MRDVLDTLESLASSENVDGIKGALVLEAEIKQWEAVGYDCLQRARSVLQRLEPARKEQLETLHLRLTKHLRDLGLIVHGDSTPLVVDGVVFVDIDHEAPIIRINGKPLAELSCESVGARVQAELKRLKHLGTSPEQFIGQLFAAYEREIRLSARPWGSQVATPLMLGHLTFIRQRPAFLRNPTVSNYIEYPIELFRADLYVLLLSGLLTHRTQRLHYASGSDPKGALFMFIPAFERVAYVGRLWFDAVT